MNGLQMVLITMQVGPHAVQMGVQAMRVGLHVVHMDLYAVRVGVNGVDVGNARGAGAYALTAGSSASCACGSARDAD